MRLRSWADRIYVHSSRAFVVASYLLDEAGGLVGCWTALVTGAGANIGRGGVLDLARHGADVLFADIDAKRYEQLDLASDCFSVQTTGTILKIDAGTSVGNHFARVFPPGLSSGGRAPS